MKEMGCYFEVRSLVLPKAGSEKADCEDSVGIRPGAGRFCIADGATEAFDSRRWARLLTKHWVFSGRSLLTREQLGSWLCALGDRFQAHWRNKKLSWYAEEKARTGAFAAFLGVEFFESANGFCWQAVALGDSCLIHLRNDQLQCSFPVSEPSQFGYHPILVPSDAGRQEAALDHVVIKDGRASIGDVFLLLSDAIAAWYLGALESSADSAAAFNAALERGDSQQLQALITECRTGGSLRNDDVAAIRIAVGCTESSVG
jgi:hypothetical protein